MSIDDLFCYEPLMRAFENKLQSLFKLALKLQTDYRSTINTAGSDVHGRRHGTSTFPVRCCDGVLGFNRRVEIRRVL